jgi:phosphate transport system substrate-binding protein
MTKKKYIAALAGGAALGLVIVGVTNGGDSSSDMAAKSPYAVEKAERLSAAGATFPAPLYQRWFQDYQKAGGHFVNYQAVGSGAGVRQYEAQTIDFGASDKAISDSKTPAQGVVHIPTTGGAIVPAYNNAGCDVQMTQTQLADVFLGKITNWSEFGCEDKQITTVYRSDGSGTTAGFTASLSAFSPEWAETVGSGKSVKWKVGIGGKGNSGVAAQIKQIDGAIGYINYGFVNSTKLQQVALQNRAGNFVTANAETSAAGLSQIVLDDNLRGSDPNPAGANAYPIVSLTWILAYPESDKNGPVADTLRYLLSEEAQSKADAIGYVPLPESIRQQSLAAVDTLKYKM